MWEESDAVQHGNPGKKKNLHQQEEDNQQESESYQTSLYRMQEEIQAQARKFEDAY